MDGATQRRCVVILSHSILTSITYSTFIQQWYLMWRSATLSYTRNAHTRQEKRLTLTLLKWTSRRSNTCSSMAIQGANSIPLMQSARLCANTGRHQEGLCYTTHSHCDYHRDCACFPQGWQECRDEGRAKKKSHQRTQCIPITTSGWERWGSTWYPPLGDPLRYWCTV